MNLPTLPSRYTNHCNPGCTSPADQTFAPVPTDQSRVQPPASASCTNSTGEQQTGHQDTSPSYNGTVTRTAASTAVTQLSGEGGQRLDRRTAEEAVPTGRGLPVNVAADSASPVKMSEPPQAIATGHGLPREVFPGSSNSSVSPPAQEVPCTSPSVTVNADTRGPGGIPVNVFIR